MRRNKIIPEHESSVRRAISDSKGINYKAIKSLDEARTYSDSYLIMKGDYGGQIYLSIPVKKIKCDYENLNRLLSELDKNCWNNKEGARVYFERMKEGEIISGGMGGGIAKKDLWVHKELTKSKREVLSLLQGKRRSTKND